MYVRLGAEASNADDKNTASNVLKEKIKKE